jgi:beta-lactamase regulating signal transducer with metallopeptidase domain
MSLEELLVIFPRTVGGFVVDHLWQTTLFSLLTIGAVFFLRRAPARLRYTLWIAVSLKFIVPSAALIVLFRQIGFDVSSFFVNVAWASGDPISFLTRQQDFFHVVEALSSAGLTLPELAFWVAIGIWLIGSSILYATWFKRHFEFRKKLKSGTAFQEGREIEALERMKTRMKIRRPVSLISSRAVKEIGVWGVFHPVIVLPENIANHLSDSELEAVLLHEMIHVSRWDNLVSNFHMAICCLFWFHPLVWLVDRMLLAERERVCDDRVIELGGVSRAYASSLIKVLRFGLGFRMAGVSCAGGSNLKRRIDSIVSGEISPQVSLFHRMALGVILLVLISFSVSAIKIDSCEMDLMKKKLSRSKTACPKSSAHQFPPLFEISRFGC